MTQKIKCPRVGCGKVRSGPCSATCYLTSSAHFTDLQREAKAEIERRELALRMNEERMDYDDE